MTSFYEPPSARTDVRPAVIGWFRVYALSLALLWAAAAYLATPALAVLALFYLVAGLLPVRPYAWTVCLVAIAAGIPSFTIVVAFPLLRAWRNPITRAAYGRPPLT